MIEVFFFLLLLPVLLLLLSKVFYEHEDAKVVFLRYWMYRNLYHLGILLGAVGKFIIPGNPSNTEDPEEAPSIEKEVVRGIKEVWKS